MANSLSLTSHKGRTRAVCSDLALRIQRVREVGPSGYMDPAVLDEDRTAALRADRRHPWAPPFVHHSLTHGRTDEMGDRDSAVPRACPARDRRHHGDRKSTGRLLLMR